MALTERSVCRELRPALRAARDAGWRVSNGGRHVKVYAPGYPRPIPFPRGQKMNHTALARKLAQLRSLGLPV